MTDESEVIRPSFPEPAEISRAYQEAQGYNRRNTGFGGIFSIILETTTEAAETESVLGPDAPAEDIYREVRRRMEESRDRADLQGDLTSFSSDDSMASIGLRLEPSGESIMAGTGERVSGRKLQPIVDSPKLFASYLQTISSRTLDSYPSIRELAIDITGVLIQTIESAFQPSPESLEVITYYEELKQLGEEKLAVFAELEHAYEHLGLDQDSYSVQLLSQYIRYWGEGILAEFIAAKKTGVLKEVNDKEFAPCMWQRDSSSESLREGWAKIVDAIKLAKSNPRGKKFASRLLKNARAHLKYARKDWKKMKRTSDISDYGEDFDHIFKLISGDLSQLAE